MIANAYRSFAAATFANAFDSNAFDSTTFDAGFAATAFDSTTFEVVGSLKTDRDAVAVGPVGAVRRGAGFVSTTFEVRQDRLGFGVDDSFELFPFFITAVYYIILRLKYNILLLSK
jgi:hypothetical protein